MDSAKYLDGLAGAVAGHDFKIVTGGPARLEVLVDAINRSQHSLRLYYYIFAQGEAGERLVQALVAARTRQVEVILLVDGFGTDDQPQDLYAPLIEAGVKFARFLPRFGRRYLLRNHQKMLIADEAVAIIGGCNIEDSYFFDRPEQSAWHDLLLCVEGEAVRRLADYYDELAAWMTSAKPKLRALTAILKRRSESEGAVRWLYGGPFRRLNPLARALVTDIGHAKSVDMIQAYFAPNWGFLRKLGQVAERGRMRLVTAALSDNQTTIAAARHCYRGLLKRGGEVFEYRPGRLHMKLIVADNAVYVGSANFDMRSLYLNTEIMIRIEDREFAGQVRELIECHLPDCNPVSLADHKRRSTLVQRLRWLAGYLVLTALDYRLTRRLNWRSD